MKKSKVVLSAALALALMNLIHALPAQAHQGGETGGGGNEIGLAAASTLRQAIADLKTMGPQNFPALNLRDLENVGRNATIIVVDEPLVVNGPNYTQVSTATNYLGEQSPLIKINSQRWEKLQDSVEKKSLMAHELLSLLKLESTGNYAISSEYARILRTRPEGGSAFDQYGCNITASEEAMKYSTMILNIQLRDANLPQATMAEVFSQRIFSDGNPIVAYPCLETVGDLSSAIKRSMPYSRLLSQYTRMDGSKEVAFTFAVNFGANLRGFYPKTQGNPSADDSKISTVFSK